MTAATPRSPRPPRPFLDHPGPKAFAHRGGAAIGPENTLAAFAHAVHDLGYTYLETDVRLTADGVVVVMHDDRLDRVAGVPHAVGERFWHELADVKIDGEHAIPTLEEVLRTFPAARLNIDAKVDDVVKPLLGVIARCDAWDRVGLAAFRDRRLATIRHLARGRIATALGPREVAALRAIATGRRSAAAGAAKGTRARRGEMAQVPARAGGVTIVDERFLAVAHARNIEVHVWTVDDAGEMRRLLDLGVDGIITDRPDTLRDVLVARGEWHAGT